MKTDSRTVVKAVWLPFITWLSAVITVAIGGKQPGVVCVTSMTWLSASWVGPRCAVYTRNQERSGRLTEAALAGGLLGLLPGLLFAAFIPLIGGIRPDEQLKAVVLVLGMILVGGVISGPSSLAICASQESRRARR
jgi:hypothetical protein